MNPESPEDRLLDELLREQAHGPDESFLKQIEAAVDAGPVAKPKPKWRLPIGLGIAAAVAGIIGVAVLNRPRQVATVAVKTEAPAQAAERTEIVEGGFKKGLIPGITAPWAPRTTARGAGSSLMLPEPDPAGQPHDLAVNDSTLGGLGAAALGRGDSGGGKGVGRGTAIGSGVGPGLGGAANGTRTENEILTGGLRSMDKSEPFDFSLQSKLGDVAAAPASAERALFGDDFSGEKLLPGSNARYGRFIDQPWKTPLRDPLSTFSIDVDTASYSNIRRMIREGRAIPRDAVRIEECINAFSYHYTPPQGDGPFAVGANLAVCPWDVSHQLVRVAIKGREMETAKRPASNLVFLIDVSGSMSPQDRLPLLRKALADLTAELDERDRVAIVVYAGSEGVVLPSTRLDAEGKAKVLKALSKLESGGSTNGGAGIKRAYELAMKEKIEGGVNRVILATDGDFNVGITGKKDLVGLVKDRAKSGVYLTVLGVGTDFNDAMMDAITHDGNGNYFYLDSQREARKVLSHNLTGTLVTIAKDVKIQVEFNPAKVGNYRLIGYSNRVMRNQDFNNDKVDAGDIGAGHTVTAFYELAPAGSVGTDALKYQGESDKPAIPPAPAGDEWLTVKLRYKHPDGDESRKIEFPLKGAPLSLGQTDTDFQFASAVALFGMKLRAMDEVKDIAWSTVRELASPGLKDDRTEDRAEFMELLRHFTDREGSRFDPETVRRIRDQEYRGERTVDDASDLYFQSYLASRDAEKLERQGDLAGALKKLESARTMVDRIRSEFPDWKTEMVEARVQMTEESIARLRRQTGDGTVIPRAGSGPTPHEAEVVPSGQVADKDFDAVDGPNVRVTRHEDGSRTIFLRSPGNEVLTRKTYTAAGALELLAIYRMDEDTNPVSCKIYDGLRQELFKIRYGYRTSDGKLVEEQMFDSRVKQTDPETGVEMPVRRLIYTYDADGKRSAPMAITLKAGKQAQEVYQGHDNFLPEQNPFKQ